MIIVIAEDHPVYAAGLSAILQKYLENCTIRLVTNGAELIDLLENSAADLALLDLQMPVMNGMVALKTIARRFPALPVIMLSTYYEERLVEDVLKAGARSYMTKNAPIEIMVEQIRTVLAGGGSPVFSGSSPVPPPPGLYFQAEQQDAYKLSRRELQIIKYIQMGYTSRRIAAELFLSFNTVRQHRKHILKKLGMRKSQELLDFMPVKATQEKNFPEA